MPNWVYNRVHGSKKICDALLGKDRLPTFTNIVPIPEELHTLESVKDSTIYEALLASLFEHNDGPLKDLYHTRDIKIPFEDWMKEITAECPLDILLAGKSLRDKYGVQDWYHFNCKYFGCKWDASSINDDPYPEDVDEIEFETPWSPPDSIMDKIASLYPNEEFTWHCDEESCAFSFDRDYHGDGTYDEHDVLAEWFTPYIAEEADLIEAADGIDNVNDLKEQFNSTFPEGCNYDIDEDPDNNSLTIYVYDWPTYGGDLLYSHTFTGIKY